MAAPLKLPRWHDESGHVLTCREKVSVLNENIHELSMMAQDAYEDALLMGVSKDQVKQMFIAIIDGLQSPYGDRL